MMDLLPHGDWRVLQPHYNHGLDPKNGPCSTFGSRNIWDEQIVIPNSLCPTSMDKGVATFSVSPKAINRLAGVKIYYSYDPNSRTRFWHLAEATKTNHTWKTEIPVYPKLPLYVFGHCRYQLDQEMTLQVGSSKTFSINSKEAIHEPHDVDLKELSKLAGSGLIEDFSNGTADWSSQEQHHHLQTSEPDDQSLQP